MRDVEVLVIGGGPAGLSAAIEAASAGHGVLILDSGLKAGGQLVKQSHKFFGSSLEYAGTRGFRIAGILLDELSRLGSRVVIQPLSTAVSCYPEEGVIGCVQGEDRYFRVRAGRIVVATGAQERLIPFVGNHLPGVYGAGAVQTLMNEYGVRPGQRVLMVGAGNIGLIVSYQLLQAGVQVAAVLEAQDRVGGYWVHAAKIRRLGVPILLRHTITKALGERSVAGAMIQPISETFQPQGDPVRVDCDIICMAVGLTPTCELLWQSGCEMVYVPQLCGHVARREPGMRTSLPHIWVAGDCAGIEEASSAMVEGRVAGLGVARSYGSVSESQYRARLAEYHRRLHRLRAGEVGDRISQGIQLAEVPRWEER